MLFRALCRPRPDRAWTDPLHPDGLSLRPSHPARQALIEAMFALGIVCSVAVCWVSAMQMTGAWGGSAARTGLILFVSGTSLLFGLRSVFLQYLVIRAYVRSTRAGKPAAADWPFVSILVPGFNEAPTIQATIRTLLAIDYPHFEVLVLDDGSTDGMADVARAYEGKHGPGECRVLTKPNGGKWSALNFGLQHARGEYVLCVDADTTFEANALALLVRRMAADPTVGAVAGNVVVRNLVNVLAYCQALEYVYANAIFRLPQHDNGMVMCVPGPIGLFRRSALDQVTARYGALPAGSPPGHFAGPYQHDTFCEDFDLSLAMLALGWRIEYEPRARCHTEVPEHLVGLISQRYRWSRGTLQVMRKVRKFYPPAPGPRGRVLRTWLYGTYYLETFTGFFFNYVFLGLSLALLVGPSAEAGVLAMYWAVNLLQRGMLCAVAVMLHRERLRLLWAWPIYEFFSSLILGGALVIAVIDHLRGTAMGWGREHRPAG